jgi:putative transcriptional regulator
MGKRKELVMKNNLKQLRSQKGLTQRELACLLKVTPSYLNKIENGKRIPNVLLAVRIAHILDCRVEDIFLI